MAKAAKESPLSAALLGAMLAIAAPVAADPVTDSSITSPVYDALLHDSLVPASEISVSTKDGVVTLTGDLDSWDERIEAGCGAFGTVGVWKVQNRLTVKDYDCEWERWEYEAPYYCEELSPNVG